MKGFALYIHVPYCFHKCPYCDFNTYAVASIPEKDYISALLSELDYRASERAWRGREVQTIFFGGGTPSLFSPSSIRKVVSAINRLFPVSEEVEITLEANPGTITPDSLSGYREGGVNRLSLGAQSFNQSSLKKLGRMHTPEQVVLGVENARTAGFHNVSVDLIFGIEDQSAIDFRDDVRQALELNPDHISAYGLTIEKGTPFFTRFKKGQLKLPSEETTLEMIELLCGELSTAGFARYEISNFAKPGKEARHNLAYWNSADYLGLGAGAHSFVLRDGSNPTGLRWSNYALPAKYIKIAQTQGFADSWRDELSKSDLIFEFFFLGLRKTAGVSLVEFQERFDERADKLFSVTLQMLRDQGLVLCHSGRVHLTQRGLLLADSVIEHFLDSDQKSYTPSHIKKGLEPKTITERELPRDGADSQSMAVND